MIRVHVEVEKNIKNVAVNTLRVALPASRDSYEFVKKLHKPPSGATFFFAKKNLLCSSIFLSSSSVIFQGYPNFIYHERSLRR